MWFVVAILARFILGSSAIVDKLLLKKSYPNPVGYTFWLGALGASAVLFIPFGVHFLAPYITIIALISGAAFTLAMLFYFIALFECEASKSLIFIGAFAPIFTLAFSSMLLSTALTRLEILAFAFLIGGGLLLFFVEERHLQFKLLGFAMTSALFFGLANTTSKLVFMETRFVSGFFWIKVGGIIIVLIFLLFRKTRADILHPKALNEFRNRFGYFANRAYAGIGSVLVSYAILLGPPSLVDATSNLQYIFIIFGAWLILKEKFSGRTLIGKVLALVFISIGVFWLGTSSYLQSTTPDPLRPIRYGVTFSEKFSKSMGLDWKKNYEATLSDLGARDIRLVAYWDLIEPERGKFDFADLDYQVSLAEKYGAHLILAVGQKVPRWPECHFPNWADNLADKERKTEVLKMVGTVVSRYKNSRAMRYWQIENELFLSFGSCPNLDKELLDPEIETARAADPKHEILVTDSGEISPWFEIAGKGDVFGTTMYRRVQNKIFGEIEYPLPPSFFRLKTQFSRLLTGGYKQKYIVVELGAEPWLKQAIYETSLAEQFRVFDLNFFKSTIDYAKATGFNEYYLWGTEWWYWLKENQNHPEFWNFAKGIISQSKN